MKLFILSNKLKQGIGIVSRLAQKSINLPILNNILFQTDKNFLKISSTDLEMGIKFWSLAQVKKQGEIAIPGKPFFNLLNFLKEEKITLTSEGNILDVEGERFQSKILGQSPKDYPLIPELKDDFIEIDRFSFSQALSYVFGVTAITQIKPELAGVYLHFSKDKILMAASDSFRLAEKTLFLKKEIPLQKEYSIILPQKTAREIINILGEDQGKMKIYFSTNQIMFETEMPETSHPQLQIISRLIEGTYPNYQEIIPKDFQTKIILKKNDFLEQLKTASLFTGKINEVQLTILPKKNGLEIFSQNPELGENRSFLSGKIEGEKLKVSFNYRFLVDGLTKIKAPEIVFHLSGEEKPAILKPLKDESYLYIVMPIKPT